MVGRAADERFVRACRTVENEKSSEFFTSFRYKKGAESLVQKNSTLQGDRDGAIQTDVGLVVDSYWSVTLENARGAYENRTRLGVAQIG